MPGRVVTASEVILSAENLNAALKQIQRTRIALNTAVEEEQAGLWFQLGVAADDLAILLTNEVIVYDMQQQGLIDLAMQRTAQSEIAILWYPEKKRFIYDGSAFREYLARVQDGEQAGESAFRLLQIEFFQADGNDAASLQLAAERKREYLQRYPDHKRAAETGILLAVDYRDLWRLSRQEGDLENTRRYGELVRDQLQRVAQRYPGTREGKIAEGLSERFEAELKNGETVIQDGFNQQ
jgi:hypothetical protein